jgi:hypothetical protein
VMLGTIIYIIYIYASEVCGCGILAQYYWLILESGSSERVLCIIRTMYRYVTTHHDATSRRPLSLLSGRARVVCSSNSQLSESSRCTNYSRVKEHAQDREALAKYRTWHIPAILGRKWSL